MILYIVATPIGNLSDLTSRAIETFKTVDAILCEDTRMTLKILNSLDFKKPLISFHQHSDERKFQDVLKMLREGQSLALVTDAGTPGISDPGGLLVAAAVKEFGNKLEVIPIPGACAAIAALSVSGFPTDKFLFLGFPPHKKGRKSYFERVAATEETVCFYESTHRILKTLGELGVVVGDRQLVVCRELTKIHETTYRGTSSDVTESLKNSSIKGEFVIIVGPKK
ncbi:MAG: Ribosomal RNA small subunit methyltransferase I [Candidatus Uhrbacteria bacterium GW2011_GWF2_44_350]|uniref:Ribosomal RNA small subunit methyltransferase I n=1 Tax=Candidatus Uhrbacteria bacterium GW2011_GWF2_44_350 TaxID=1619000 RepID=A0A0G1JJQ7_9BACT|nr:MAG: Ribosomal RNA small subunit methyltransferase I [Candidatus Uhrbacteria bacterium GW2011_GWF2_44_350]HBR80063.1 16S rRNA (cytidine(1402)-2'-O)-methyltransferase [Candidatus Uhrbacteria bacterium]HCU31235.1 16S rRNA (cytidine(1402)-2'-O)-methyltransferase [Candidatus Uhrbacteria bacterium]